MKKAEAYTWMAQWKGHRSGPGAGGYVPSDKSWVEYDDYMELWNEYEKLKAQLNPGLIGVLNNNIEVPYTSCAEPDPCARNGMCGSSRKGIRSNR